jgi:hypothetical protein
MKTARAATAAAAKMASQSVFRSLLIPYSHVLFDWTHFAMDLPPDRSLLLFSNTHLN